MPRLQQKLVRNAVITGPSCVCSDCVFMGKRVFTSEYFCYFLLRKYHKKRSNRLLKKWRKRYGELKIPRNDAEIYSYIVICHPETLWRFKEDFFKAQGEPIGDNEHDIHL